jgi:hypothetical protein
MAISCQLIFANESPQLGFLLRRQRIMTPGRRPQPEKNCSDMADHTGCGYKLPIQSFANNIVKSKVRI